MEQLLELKKRLEQERPTPWEELPDIALYMDQLISYMPRQLIRFEGGETLTPAMVNNYIKDGLVPRAEGKRYGPSHLGYLTAVCALKRVLSVREIKALLAAAQDIQTGDGERYAYFCQAMDQALDDAADSIRPEASKKELARTALELALRGYASQLACARILEVLQPAQEEPKKSKHRE